MSGNSTTGERIFPDHKGLLLTEEDLLGQLDGLRSRYRLLGPVDSGGGTVFRPVESAARLNMAGGRTMISPAREFFFKPRQQLVQFDMQSGAAAEEPAEAAEPSLLAGIHPCDVHALLYLDRALANDPHYQAVRRNTLLLALNCQQPSRYCFCSSMDTGPFLGPVPGCDLVLTRMADGYLLEPLTDSGTRLFTGDLPVGYHWQEKKYRQEKAGAGIKKELDPAGLEQLLRSNLNHAVWARTAEERCLSCANCVMVCPTCFCHDIRDRVDMDLRTTWRYRQWDACQDMGFAEVHGGNFRRTRGARLRQFVLHKLDYRSQFGLPGTVGCGRCIEWCPTAIDLTEMAREIRNNPDE